ncbi:hypothetical protein KEM60_00475 [Austwickia sp. TVS 96-490-7B]|uniref:hypothetical protein n=1 Tax=Austwickia sp. TVS 96-490-7B TaxID=2830843 RepID=UPI001C590A8D|nr:hypothetical protein [Austwickia sp. TVS 96-490-7B]MBW3084288.1 hypothetical protein [Austwickia sp. TVS 96-490-7B]
MLSRNDSERGLVSAHTRYAPTYGGETFVRNDSERGATFVGLIFGWLRALWWALSEWVLRSVGHARCVVLGQVFRSRSAVTGCGIAHGCPVDLHFHRETNGYRIRFLQLL